MNRLRGFLWLSLASVVACSADVASPTPREGTGRQSSTIVGGDLSGPEDNYVVRIRSLKQKNSATGVMIAPNLVMTAAHVVANLVGEGNDNTLDCVKGVKGVTIFSLLPAVDFEVFAGENLIADKYPAPIPSKKIFSFGNEAVCDGDVGIIMLEAPLPNTTIVPIRLDPSSKVDEAAYAIGWGMIDQYGTFPKKRQRHDANVVALGPGQYQTSKGLITFDLFDAHLAARNFNPCYGDSGGGLFSYETGALLGVLSTVVNEDPTQKNTSVEPSLYCLGEDVVTLYTRPDPFKDKLIEIFREAGHAPWREGKPMPAAYGQACTEDLDCDSLVCVAGQCSRECASNPCDADKECMTIDKKQVCAPPGYQPGAGGAGGASQGTQGSPCTTFSDCASSICISTGEQKVCSASCESAPCSDGWTCTNSQDKKICLPPSPVAPADEGCSSSGRGAGAGSGLFALLALGALACRKARRA